MKTPPSSPEPSSRVASLIRDIEAEFANRRQQIAEKCEGAEVDIAVDFASFGNDYDALLRVPQLGLKETVAGFRRFCTHSDRTRESDPVKAGAVRAKVKKILLRNVATAAERGIRLEKDGIVVLDMAFADAAGGLNPMEIQRELGIIL